MNSPQGALIKYRRIIHQATLFRNWQFLTFPNTNQQREQDLESPPPKEKKPACADKFAFHVLFLFFRKWRGVDDGAEGLTLLLLHFRALQIILSRYIIWKQAAVSKSASPNSLTVLLDGLLQGKILSSQLLFFNFLHFYLQSELKEFYLWTFKMSDDL